MRSIISISLAAALFATPLAAKEVLDCYSRTYSEAHLKAQPQQVASAIMVQVAHEFGSSFAYVAAEMTNAAVSDGAASVAGKWLDTSLYCGPGAGIKVGALCVIDCDGGAMTIDALSEDSLIFSTQHLTIGDSDGCSGASNLGEVPGETVRYRLDRAPAQICEARLK